MAKLSNVKRIIKEQMPADVQKWIDTLLYPLNNTISQLSNALANQLTIVDNMQATVKSFTLKSNQFPFTFNHGLSGTPKVLYIGQINDTAASPATFTVAPYAQWTIGTSASTIVIQTITGLDPTKTYNVTFVIHIT